MAKISCIVPVFNSEKYLKKCLDSIILQTFGDIEIICINDSSVDNSKNILEEYSKKDERIKIITKEHQGAASARNEGLKIAKGEYISFIDSDDWVSLGLYENFIKDNKDKNVDIYMFNGTFEKETYSDVRIETFFNIHKWKNYKNINSIHTFDDCMSPFGSNMSVCNKIYKKSFLDENNINFMTGVIFEDQIFYLKSFLKAKSILLSNEIRYKYRQNVQNQVTSTFNQKGFDIFKVMDRLEDLFKETEKFEEYKYAFLQHKYQEFSYIFFKIDDDKKEEFYLEMKNRIKQIDFSSFNPGIVKKLINSHCIEDIINLDYKAFYSKNEILFNLK